MGPRRDPREAAGGRARRARGRRRGAPRPLREAGGRAALSAPRPDAHGPVHELDDLARRSGRHGSACGGCFREVPAAEAQARRARRPRRRACPRGAQRHGRPAAGGRERVLVARGGARRAAAARGARRRVLRAAAPGGRSRWPRATCGVADSDLRRRGLPHARRRGGVRRARARDQHQAREVGRRAGGGADGVGRPGARARRHARLHARVGPRHRAGGPHRVAVRPRRPRRQPPAARRPVAGRAVRGRPPGPIGPARSGRVPEGPGSDPVQK